MVLCTLHYKIPLIRFVALGEKASLISCHRKWSPDKPVMVISPWNTL